VLGSVNINELFAPSVQAASEWILGLNPAEENEKKMEKTLPFNVRNSGRLFQSHGFEHKFIFTRMLA
jgi:hypothetical protein